MIFNRMVLIFQAVNDTNELNFVFLVGCAGMAVGHPLDTIKVGRIKKKGKFIGVF